MDLIEKFAPERIHELKPSDFAELTIDALRILSETYPLMKADLLVVKLGTDTPQSPATYKSFYQLIKRGLKLQLIGTRYKNSISPIKQELDIEIKIDPIVDEYIEPSIPLFNEEPVKKTTRKYKRK